MNLNIETNLNYDSNSYSSSYISACIEDGDCNSSDSSIHHYDDIINNSYIPRLSIISNNTINIQSNDIYERKKFIQFIIDQNTYLNNTKYQKVFNEIIFNFNI